MDLTPSESETSIFVEFASFNRGREKLRSGFLLLCFDSLETTYRLEVSDFRREAESW